MELETRRVYLQMGRVTLKFVGTPPSKCSESVLLFTPKLGELNGFRGESYDHMEIAKISEIIAEAERLVDNKPTIEMFGKFDKFHDVPRIYTKMAFPKPFIQKLLSIVPDARISITGYYEVMKRKYRSATLAGINAERLERAAPGMRLGSLEELRAQRNIVSGIYYGYPESPAFWEPVDEKHEDFSVESMELKEQATYESFKGIEKMVEYYRSQALTRAQLTFSVILEWKDFVREDPKKLERTLLDKLYDDGKPLADCTIVAANDKEIRCHRAVVAMHSDVLFGMLTNGMKESQTQRIEMKDVGGEAVDVMIAFMYGKNLSLEKRDEQVILDVIMAAHKYNISGLEILTARLLYKKPKEWFTMNGLLALYLFIINVDSLKNLTEKLKTIMRSNTDDLYASATYQEWLEQDSKQAAQFAFSLVKSPKSENADVVENASEAEPHTSKRNEKTDTSEKRVPDTFENILLNRRPIPRLSFRFPFHAMLPNRSPSPSIFDSSSDSDSTPGSPPNFCD